MAKLLKLRRGTTTQHGSFTGAEGEVTIDTTKDTAVVHDGSQAGGRPLAREDMTNVSSASIAGRLSNDSIAPSKIGAGTLPSDVTVASANIVDGTIVNADVNTSAAIAGTKISPDFGSQNITTTGTIRSTGNGGTISVGDNNDLFITHTNNGLIDNNTGDLTIQTQNAMQLKTADAEFGIQLVKHGGVQLYHDNTGPKLETTSSGIDVTGRVTADDLTVQNTSGNLSAFFTATNGLGTLEVGGSTGAFIDLKTPASDDYDLRIDASGTLTSTGAIALNTASGQSVSVQRNLDVGAGVDVTGNITVTGTVDGRDVAADGSKLDGIESGATADQTGAEIASALNGQNVYTTGNIGRDSNDYIQWGDNAQLDVYVNGNNEFRFEADGDFHADGDITAFSTTVASDSRLKSDIHTINNALGIVGKLRGVSYKWLRDGRSDIGVIAQEVEEVIPEIVKTKTTLGLDGQEEMKTVDYGKIVGVLINAINELKEEVEELKNAKITG